MDIQWMRTYIITTTIYIMTYYCCKRVQVHILVQQMNTICDTNHSGVKIQMIIILVMLQVHATPKRLIM